MRRASLIIAVALIATLSTLPACFAQALADHVPADAILYVGWKGTDTLGPEYDQSHLKAIAESSQFRQIFTSALPQLIAHIRARDPMASLQAANAMQTALDLSGYLWRRPSAFYCGGFDPGNPAATKLAILCDGGPEADTIAQYMRDLIMDAGGVPVKVQEQGTIVIVSTFTYPDQIAAPLASEPAFVKTMAVVGKDPVMASYLDATAAMSVADGLIERFAPPEFQQRWPVIRDMTGLSGLKHVACTAGFEGRNWVAESFVDAPSPRQGLLAGGQPLTDELIAAIPDTSILATARTFDLSNLYNLVQLGFEQLAPDGGLEFHRVMATANAILGLDIQKELLASFGSQWAFYVDPNSSGSGMLGGTLVNRPRDPGQLEDALNRFTLSANTLLQRMLQNRFTVEFRQQPMDGVQLHYLATPAIAPAWAIKDGAFYLGLYPQVVAAALDRPADAKSILSNPAYQQVHSEIGGPDKPDLLVFDDLPKTAPGGYQSLLFLSQLYLGFGDIAGGALPPLVIPSLDKIMPELEPSGMAVWQDDAGWHTKAVTPFPGADALGTANAGGTLAVGQSAMLISILLPSLNKARETANRVKSQNNLKQIGLACALYCNDHHGAYPSDMGTLIKTEDISIQVFVCPSTNTVAPAGLPMGQQADWVNANSDYIYIGQGLTNAADASIVVAYEKDNVNGGAGISLLFADGHVEFLALPDAHQQIDASQKLRGH